MAISLTNISSLGLDDRQTDGSFGGFQGSSDKLWRSNSSSHIVHVHVIMILDYFLPSRIVYYASRVPFANNSYDRQFQWCFQKHLYSRYSAGIFSQLFLVFLYGKLIVSSFNFRFQDANYASATRQKVLAKIKACEQLQKFCEHKQVCLASGDTVL